MRLSQEEAAATLSKAREDLTCGACRELFDAPVILPCGHIFCSLCARRALLSRSNCLEAGCGRTVTTTDLRPVRALAAVAATVARRNAPPAGDRPERAERRPYLPLAKRLVLHRNLKELGLRATGTVEELATRYREFVLRWNANLDALHPVSERTVALQVTKHERDMAAASKPPSVFQRRGAYVDDDDDDMRENPNAPCAGDDFAALVAKVQRRENRPPPEERRIRPTPPEPPDEHGNFVPVDPMNDRAVELNVPNASATESDLAYAQAAHEVAQTLGENGNANAAASRPNMEPQSPTDSDLQFMAAADEAESRSQDLLNADTRSTSLSRTPLRPREVSHAASSQSTLPPSPQHVAPANHSATSYSPGRPPPVPRASPPRVPQVLMQAVPAPTQRYGAGNITIGPRHSQMPPASQAPSQPAQMPHHVAAHAVVRSPHQDARQHASVAPPRPQPFVHTPTRPPTAPLIPPTSATPTRGAAAWQGRPFSGAAAANNLPSYHNYTPTAVAPPAAPPPPHAPPPVQVAHRAVVTEPVPRRPEQQAWRQQVSNGTQPSFSQPPRSGPSQLSPEVQERIERNRQRAIQLQMAKRRRIEASRQPSNRHPQYGANHRVS